MKLHTTNVGTRLGGTALGLGFFLIGVFAASYSGDAPSADIGDRSFWLGVTFAIAGACAMSVSWLVQDLSNIWCSPPRRFHRTKSAGRPRDGAP